MPAYGLNIFPITGLPLCFHFPEFFFLSPLQKLQACYSLLSYCHLTYPLNPLLCASQSSVFHINLLFLVASIPKHSFHLPIVSDLFPTISKNITGSMMKCKVQFVNMTNQRGTQNTGLLLSCSHATVFFSELPAQAGQELPANTGDARNSGLIPRLGRSPGEGNGNPLQYSCLGNLMDRGAWWATVHGVAKSQTRLSTCTLT